MPGTFLASPRVSDTDMHHGTCMTHVPWCMPGSLTSGFLWSRWRGKHSRHFPRMRNPQFYVSGKRPIEYPQVFMLLSCVAVISSLYYTIWLINPECFRVTEFYWWISSDLLIAKPPMNSIGSYWWKFHICVRLWRCAIKQYVVTRISVDLDLCRYIASLSRNELRA